MSIPFPFRIGYLLDYVCHSGSLPNGGVTSFVFQLIVCWLVSSFFTDAFVRDHVCHPYAIAGKTHW